MCFGMVPKSLCSYVHHFTIHTYILTFVLLLPFGRGDNETSADGELLLLKDLLQQEQADENAKETDDLIDRILHLIASSDQDGKDAGETPSGCVGEQFQCITHDLCINASWVCDGLVDCPGESDETNCFACTHGKHARLLPNERVCDGVYDCSDGEDEHGCKSPCGSSEFPCDPTDVHSKCVPKEWTCDGMLDCPNMEDEVERLCGPYRNRCGDGDFVCGHRQFCLPSVWLCDGADDCGDRSDEENCDGPNGPVGVQADEVLAAGSTIWGGWSGWSRCSAACDGEQTRVRRCQYGFCYGQSSDVKACGEAYPCTDEPASGCGARDFKIPTGRIVGGRDAQLHEWPWQVQIYRLRKMLPFCGGCLIRRNWVLTAAHCFFPKALAPSRYTVAIGRQHTMRHVVDESAIEVQVKRIIIHEGNAGAPQKDDVALMELMDPVPNTDGVNVICLPKSREDLTKFSTDGNPDCYVTGFGLNEIGKRPTVMQVAHVPLIEHATCSAPHVYGYRVIRSMLCAGHLQGGIDACQGDSGGPLVCQNQRDGRWYQVGITSWGKGCGLPNRPGVYTRLTEYIDWIESHIER